MKYDIGLTYSQSRASPRTMTQSDIAELVVTAGWVHNSAEAVCVVMAESSGQTAVESANPDGNKNIGLFQIDTVNVIHGEYLKDPVYNANVARRMYLADGGFKKHWATASACADKKGNAPLSDEASPTAIGGAADAITGALSPSGIADAITGGIASILNSIPWFRITKGVVGYFLIIGGAFSLVFVVANRASKTPVGKAALKVIP